MSRLRDRLKQVIRNQLSSQSGNASKYQLGTVVSVNDDGTVLISLQGTNYVAAPLYPLVQGQECIVVFGDAGKISAVPTGQQPPEAEVIHPPFFSGAPGGIRFLTNSYDVTKVPGSTLKKQLLLEDTITQNVFVLSPPLPGTTLLEFATNPTVSGNYPPATFSPNGKFLSVVARDSNLTTTVVIFVYSLGTQKFSGLPIAPPLFSILPKLVSTGTLTISSGTRGTAAILVDVFTDDAGVTYALIKSEGTDDATAVFYVYRLTPSGNPTPTPVLLLTTTPPVNASNSSLFNPAKFWKASALSVAGSIQTGLGIYSQGIFVLGSYSVLIQSPLSDNDVRYLYYVCETDSWRTAAFDLVSDLGSDGVWTQVKGSPDGPIVAISMPSLVNAPLNALFDDGPIFNASSDSVIGKNDNNIFLVVDNTNPALPVFRVARVSGRPSVGPITLSNVLVKVAPNAVDVNALTITKYQLAFQNDVSIFRLQRFKT